MDNLYGLKTLMSSLGINSSERYDGYWESVISPLESQELNIDGFVWATPQISLDYAILEAKEKVSAMATYTALSSIPTAVGQDANLRKLTGNIPRSRHLIRLTEEDVRNKYDDFKNIEASADFLNINRQVAISELLEDYLFEKQSDIAVRHRNSLNYAVGQVKSLAQLGLTYENNPRGIRGVDFKMHVPDGNFMTHEWFEKKADGTLVDIDTAYPLKDLKDFVLYLKRNKYLPGMEIDENLAYAVVHHVNVIAELGYVLNPSLRAAYNDDKQAAAVANSANDQELYEALRKYLNIPELKVSPTFVEVDKYDKDSDAMVSTRLRAFDAETVLIRPIGIIGKIMNVTPLRSDDSAVIGARLMQGRGLVEYFYDAKHKIQEWVSELTVLPVLTRPKDMYYFKVVKAAS
jgi:hypothetical protein